MHDFEVIPHLRQLYGERVSHLHVNGIGHQKLMNLKRFVTVKSIPYAIRCC